MSNIFKLTILNIILYSILMIGLTINNGIAQQQDFTNYTYTESLTITMSRNVTSITDTYLGDFVFNKTYALRSPRGDSIFDNALDGIVNFVDGGSKIIGLLVRANAPLASLRSIMTSDNTFVNSILLLFLTIWQSIIVLYWLKFVWPTRFT